MEWTLFPNALVVNVSIWLVANAKVKAKAKENNVGKSCLHVCGGLVRLPTVHVVVDSPSFISKN